jgi:O-methyltransferase domain/Dimerisation domain
MAAEAPAAQLLRLLNGYQLSQALHVAATLGIADCLQKGPRSAGDLAQEIGAHPRSLYRLLRALAAADVLREEHGECFALTPLGEPLRSDHPTSLAAWAVLIGRPYQWQSWGHLLQGVRTAETPFKTLFGTDVWEWRAQHLDESAIFDRAMTANSRSSNAAILAAFDFSRFARIADIGGGHGAFLTAILQANPTARGVLFDQPHVVSGAGPVLRQGGVDDRCEVVGGNVFESIPAGADAYTLRGMLCDYDDVVAADVLRTCRRAMSPTSRLLVVDRLLDGPNEGVAAKLFDLTMLVITAGTVRTPEEFATLFEGAGFELVDVTRSASPLCVIEAAPA